MKADRSSSPGFIALVEWAFRRFMLGSKDTEFRIHGGRFVAKHYPVGRLVVISAGYGRDSRALTRVRSFDVLDAPPDLAQWERVYGPWPPHAHQMKVAAIGLDVLAPIEAIPSCYPPIVSVWDREWIGFDRLEAIVREIPAEVWSVPRVRPDRPCQGAVEFWELAHKSLRRAPIYSSLCDCTTIVADELPDSDAFCRAWKDAMFGSFVSVGPEIVALDRVGFHRGPGFVEGLPGPPSRLEAAFLASPANPTLLEALGIPGDKAAETDNATLAFLASSSPLSHFDQLAAEVAQVACSPETLPPDPTRVSSLIPLPPEDPKSNGLPSWFPIDGLPFDFVGPELRASFGASLPPKDFDGPHSPS